VGTLAATANKEELQMDLKDRVVLVTGAGSGIGQAIALAMAQAGANVVVADIDLDAAERTANNITKGGDSAASLQVDCSNPGSIDNMVAQVIDHQGRLDVLVNNAGVSRQIDIMDVTPADWDRIFSVNARGVFFCLQRAAREMIPRGGGRIINISSIAARGYPRVSNIAYVASKGAVIAMTKTASQQFGPLNINVNAICPGMTMTALASELFEARARERGLSFEEIVKESIQEIPIRRANDPSDIAGMAVFLASDKARNINGQAFNVDGGLVPS
jgi:NAD(P)-dependent dehydrogenase (short-subunit alcohol dehydrogenase family)